MLEKQDKYVGTVQGLFTVIGLHSEKSKDGHKLYHAKCNICGYEITAQLRHLQRATNCRHQLLGNTDIAHKGTWTNTRLRSIFRSIKRRCYNKNDTDYIWYGAKGIKICDDWLNNPKSFEDWALANGYADNLTIDRIDSAKDYSPDNCRWITHEENCRRAGKVNWITVNNLTMSGRQWSIYLNLGPNFINTYIKQNGLEQCTLYIKQQLTNLYQG